MKKILLTTIACAALILGSPFMSQPARAADAGQTLTGTVQLQGVVKETIQGDKTGINDYEDKYVITATYEIKLDSNGKLDPAKEKSTVTFHDPKYDFTTNPIYVTKVKVDPVSGKLISFEFSREDWDKAPKAGAINNGFDGSITINKRDKTKGAGSMKSSYKIGASITDYIFDTNGQRPAQPKKNRRTGRPVEADTTIEENESLDYDATTRRLSIRGDEVVGTPAPSDPILGAAANFPDFQFEGFSLDGGLAIFWPADGTFFTLTKGGAIYEQSRIPVLYYDVKHDVFYGALRDTTLAGMAPDSPFYDPNLPAISSPFFDDLDGFLNPLSLDFDPKADLYVTITPNTNYAELTNDFTESAGTGGKDLHFAARPVPEPSTLVLFGFGLCALLGFRRRAEAVPVV